MLNLLSIITAISNCCFYIFHNLLNNEIFMMKKLALSIAEYDGLRDGT